MNSNLVLNEESDFIDGKPVKEVILEWQNMVWFILDLNESSR